MTTLPLRDRLLGALTDAAHDAHGELDELDSLLVDAVVDAALTVLAAEVDGLAAALAAEGWRAAGQGLRNWAATCRKQAEVPGETGGVR